MGNFVQRLEEPSSARFLDPSPESDHGTSFISPQSSSSDSFQLTSSEDNRNPPNTKSNPNIKLWTAGFVVFTLLDCLLIVLAVLVFVDLARLQNSPSGPKSNITSPALLEDSAFCLPCLEVYVNEIEVLQNRFKVVQKKDEWNTTLCCAEAHDDLKTLVGDMFIRVHYPRDRASGSVTVVNMTEAADDQSDVIRPHLLLEQDPEGEPQEVNGTHAVPLRLSKRAAPADEPENASSVFFHDGAVKIVHPGHFYIHSHVPFDFNLLPTVLVLTQYVYRVRNGGETLLLENSVFPCDVSSRSCEHSFVAGLFLLETGDEVVLRVSNHSYVEREKDVEFGIHRL